MTMARRGCLDKLGTSGRWRMALTQDIPFILSLSKPLILSLSKPLILSLSKDGVQVERVNG